MKLNYENQQNFESLRNFNCASQSLHNYVNLLGEKNNLWAERANQHSVIIFSQSSRFI